MGPTSATAPRIYRWAKSPQPISPRRTRSNESRTTYHDAKSSAPCAIRSSAHTRTTDCGEKSEWLKLRRSITFARIARILFRIVDTRCISRHGRISSGRKMSWCVSTTISTHLARLAPIPLQDSPFEEEKTNTVTHAPRSGKLAQNARHVADWLNAHRAYRTSSVLEWLGVWKLCHEGGQEFAALTPEEDARLREQFLPDVEALEELIRRDLSAWKPRSQTPARFSSCGGIPTEFKA